MCMCMHTYMYVLAEARGVILQILSILLSETVSLTGTLGPLINLVWLDPPITVSPELVLQA